MDVRGPHLQRARDHLIDQADHRRLAGHVAQVGDIVRFAVDHDVGPARFELGLGMCREMLGEGILDLADQADSDLHGLPDRQHERLGDGAIARIGDRDLDRTGGRQQRYRQVLLQELRRQAMFETGQSIVIFRLDRNEPCRLGDRRGKVAFADKSQLHQQRAQQATFFGLQACHPLKLLVADLAGLDQPFAQ